VMEPVNQDTNEVQWFQLSNKTYNKLKALVQIILPAFSTLYFALAAIWSLPNAEQVVATSAAFTLFLGTVLGISTRSYKNTAHPFDGTLDVSIGDTGIKTYSLELFTDPEQLDSKDVVRFKVKS